MKPELNLDSRKRIAIYLPTLVGGGAERVMLNLATQFVKRGVLVDFLLAQCEGAFMTEFPDSVHLIELNSIHVKFGRSILSLPALVRYIRRERPATILTGLHANIIVVWAKRLAGVPLQVVITEHNTLSFQKKTQSVVFRLLSSWLIRLNYPQADEIIAVSNGVADDLSVSAMIPRKKISVIYNPIITPELIAKRNEKLNHPWFKPGEPPVVLAIGRLTAQKDFPLLIRAFADVRKYMQVRLLILGDGPDRNELQSLVKKLGLEDEISLPGFIHNPYPYMTHASVFVLSSLWEGLPTVLVEALYCGIPLVSTDCPSGPREILDDGKYGKLVPVGDQTSLTEAILSTLNSNQVHPPFQSWQPFEADYVVDQYLSLLLGKSS